MRIEVTEEDIRKGIRFDGHCCPIANAIRRIYGCERTTDVGVDEDNITFFAGGYEDTYPTPEAAKLFVEAFDAGKPVDPFAFDLGEDRS